MKRFFPYTLIETDWFQRYGLLTSLLFYLLLVITNVAYGIESNTAYTQFFIGSMLVLMLLMVVLFGHKAYCMGACPVGLFIRLYEPAILNRMESNGTVCSQCKKRAWIEEKFLIPQPTTTIQDNRDWRFRVECLKKCPRKSTVMKFRLPFKNWLKDSDPTWIQVFAPGIVLLIFTVSLVEKSNFFLRFYEQVTAVFPIDLVLFNLISISLVILLITGANILLLHLFCRVTAIKPRLIYQKLGGLSLLLILFHFSLVVGEFSELGVLFQQFPVLNFLHPEFFTFETTLCLPCILTAFGIIITFIYGAVVANSTANHPMSIPKTGLSMLLFTVYLGQYTFFTIVALKLLPYVTC